MIMNRRLLLGGAAAALIAPSSAFAAKALNYQPGLVDTLLAEGHTVFIDFFTHWCSTCAAQKRVIDALKKQNPAYEKSITFVNVDWDVYARDDLSTRLNIPRRSTLVALKGDRELGRIVAGTSKSDIQTLMDRALLAATS